ncbi:DUF1934 domain-containing protein [Alkalihalobacillus sp. AL-G]|uniref:DUF1934 domain-containing protein n=1 Tax=Alkalihalobacillus sp. AL-G TaxID=2926399 RepID=UPI00272D582C|nr:DUF1934 domain-containing protein [Alkalihalobacillus sp. AL-G]WLD93207.1 DUF1934 domain-containing protein [Alkalihalobacillus sp. AL-G]
MDDSTPITISLHSISDQSGEQEEIRFSAPGTLYQKESATYVRYEEVINETDKVNTTIKITDGDATIIRRGAVSMRQQFIQGEQTDGTYGSLYGPIKIGTDTKSMDFKWDERTKVGALSLEYRVLFEGEETGNHQLSIRLKGERT